MERARQLSDELVFTAIGTAEVARQALTHNSGTIGSQRIKEIHVERSAGAGTLNFYMRAYSAAAGGKKRVDVTLSLAASGAEAQAYQGGLDILLEADSYWTIEAASGSGHGVKLVVTYGPARD
jgi:hypothetical protein